jgi:hypothetical protein
MYIAPTIVPFSVFDAQEFYVINFINDEASGQFDSWTWVLNDITDNRSINWTDTMIFSTDVSIEKYIENDMYDKFEPEMIYSTYDKKYCLIINPKFFQNGHSYSMQLCFLAPNSGYPYTTDLVNFKCYSTPMVELENCKYQDGTEVAITDTIVIEKASCKLTYSYSQNEGDGLKYYQFFLYDKDINGNERFLGNSNKFYSQSKIEYTVENYNNLKDYVLKLYCVTQSGVEQWCNIHIFINYNQNDIYANIIFELDKQLATNNVHIKVTQLTGSGEGYTYTESGDSITIPDDGYVEFIDQYQAISNNFLCKMWCTNLSGNVPVFTINTTEGIGYVEVLFTGTSFIAKKHSCGLTTSYVCYIEDVETNISQDTDIYFAIGYFDGRIEMYATIL